MLKSKNNQYKKSSIKKKIIITLITIFIICIALFIVLETTNTTSFLKQSSTSKNDEKQSETTSNIPSAQSNFTSGDSNREPGNTLHEDHGSAIIEETDQQTESNPSPIISNTGEISIYSPIKNSVIKSGSVISGSSTLSKVEYRIIDSVSGVIAMGALTVKDGKFSGKITFNTNASEGRIDLFATKPDFSEYSNIEIPIRFKD